MPYLSSDLNVHKYVKIQSKTKKWLYNLATNSAINTSDSKMWSVYKRKKWKVISSKLISIWEGRTKDKKQLKCNKIVFTIVTNDDRSILFRLVALTTIHLEFWQFLCDKKKDGRHAKCCCWFDWHKWCFFVFLISYWRYL